MKSLLNKKTFFLYTFLLVAVSVFSQSNPPTPSPPPPGLPINGGVILLTLLALSYGVSKKK